MILESTIFVIFIHLDIPEIGNVQQQRLFLPKKFLKVSLNADEISIAHALKQGKTAPLLYIYCICSKVM